MKNGKRKKSVVNNVIPQGVTKGEEEEDYVTIVSYENIDLYHNVLYIFIYGSGATSRKLITNILL